MQRAGGFAVRISVRARIPLSVALAVAILGLAGASRVRAQSPGPSATPLAFEVASIKPSADIMTAVNAGKMPHVGMKVDNQSVDVGYFTLAQSDHLCLQGEGVPGFRAGLDEDGALGYCSHAA